MSRKVLLYRDIDPREFPAYSLADASHYLGLPAITLKSWLVGRDYPTQGGTQRFEPLVYPRGGDPLKLSFTNLVECHVLASIRRHHRVKMNKVRPGLRYLESVARIPHPLANCDFLTDKSDLFVDFMNHIVNVSRSGQYALDAVRPYLSRIERDVQGLAAQLFPIRFTADAAFRAPRAVAIDPTVSFGRPVLAGTGITTAILAERFRCGEDVKEIAGDYGWPEDQIAQAIAWEEEQTA